MTTQVQGKGKKKNKDVMKVSLDEFNQIDAPIGHSVVSLKTTTTGLDWAATMADYDQQSSETQQIIVPAAPRAQRGPGVDYDSLPDTGPFRVSVHNLPMSVEEAEIQQKFFAEIEVIRIEISKSNTTVELASKDALYHALCKDGISYKGRTVNVCLYGQTPQNSYADRYGGRGGNSNWRDGDRNQSGFGGQRTGDRYGDRSGERYGDRFGDRSGDRFGERTGDRFSERTGDRFGDRAGDRFGDRPRHYQNQPSYNSSYSQFNNQAYGDRSRNHQNQQPNNSPHPQFYNSASSNNRPLTTSSTTEERPKLVLSKRKAPLNVDDVSSVSRNEAIFGKAKPSSTPYEKMNEVEEKLKAVQIGDRKESKPSSQTWSQPGSASRSRRVSSNNSESNS